MVSNNAADAPVNPYVATETPLQTCQLTSGYIEITGINSTAPAVSITLDVEEVHAYNHKLLNKNKREYKRIRTLLVEMSDENYLRGR
jgi:hypothetical protein